MKTYQNFRVDIHHCDSNANLRVTEMLRFMQQCSSSQLENSAISQEKLVKMGKTYVLCRLNISIYKSVHPGEEIEVSTWPCESRGLSLTRCYQVRVDGSIVAEAITVWGVVDIETRRLCRVSSLPVDLECEEPLELDSPSRVYIPSELNLNLVGERTVVYSDLDINSHVNNTNYADMICDFLPEMQQKRVIMMGISYVSEAKLGEVLKVYMTKSEGQYYIRTLKESGEVNMEAIVMLERINTYDKI